MFWKYIRKHKKLVLLALVLATINQVFSLLDPQIFRLIIDKYATKFETMPSDVFIQGVLLLLLAAVGVAFVSRIAKNFQDYYVNVITQKSSTELYARSVNHTLSLPYSIFEDQRSGEILQKLQKARLDLQNVITSMINILFLSLVGVIFVLIYAFTVHWMIGLAYVVIIPVLGAFIFYISKSIKAAQKPIVKETAELAGSTTETLRNVELVKSLGLEQQEIERLNATNAKILELELKKVKLVRKLSFIQGTMINLMRSALLLLMLWMIYNQHITLGEFFTLLFYSFFIFNPLGELGTVATQYQEFRASIEQLEQILHTPPVERKNGAKTIDTIKNISFNDVSFQYGSRNEDSLRHVMFNLKAGETVAFVGPSGSGKSTIIKLILGLYDPTRGKVHVNNDNMRDIDQDAFRQKIGLVAQETQLFAGTIRENLLFVNPSATDAECMKALREASIISIVERGNKGLDSKIGEGGIKLSGGERQRLAIARALLRNPEILIFDEATSSLDSITEKHITRTIEQVIASRPRTITVLIAHRLSTVARASKIYVLEKGKIVESGTHQSLLKKKGLYSALWREQQATSGS